MQPTIPKPCLLLRPPLKLEWTTIYPLHDTTRPTVCVARALYLVTLAAYIRNPWTASMRRWSLRLPSEGMPCNCASSGYMHCLLSQCLQPACLVTPGCSHGGAKWCSGAAVPLSPVQGPASVHLRGLQAPQYSDTRPLSIRPLCLGRTMGAVCKTPYGT